MHRRERQKDLLEAEPYDLDMLDEADHARIRRESNSSVAAFGEAPCNAVPEGLRKSPLRKRKVLRALNDIDPIFLRETLEKPGHLSENWGINQGQD